MVLLVYKSHIPRRYLGGPYAGTGFDPHDSLPVCQACLVNLETKALSTATIASCERFSIAMASTALRHASRSMTHEERAIRVEDYINDKLQTYADLESLDALLENVQNQQTLLRKQVSLGFQPLMAQLTRKVVRGRSLSSASQPRPGCTLSRPCPANRKLWEATGYHR